MASARISAMLQTLRIILGFSCLSAWLWLVLRSYGDPVPFLFNDEFGRLSMVLPVAAILLAALGLEPHLRTRPASRRWLWNAGCAALCSPLLLQLRALAPAAWLVDGAVSLLGGFGFAAGFLTLGVAAARCTRSIMLCIACGGIIVTSILMQALPALQPGTLLLMPVILALGARLFLEPGSGDDRSGRNEKDTAWPAACSGPAAGNQLLWALLLLFVLAGFSQGLYSSMLAVMEPLLPRPQPFRAFLLAVNVGVAAVCIQQARRSILWRAALLTGPLLMVGYTAWPLLHRESPALSLGGLHFAQIFLGIFCLVTLFYGAAHQDHEDGGWRFLGLGAGAVLTGLFLGLAALSPVRESFSHGITVNSIFALLAVAVLLSYWAYVLLLGRMEFWTGPRAARGDRLFARVFEQEAAHEAAACEVGMRPGEDRPPELYGEECGEVFRTFGLTRQQALVAAMLAQKRPDAEICAALNISPNTLKTHIRNILHRLHINSRHELPWLVAHVRGMAQGEGRHQGNAPEG